MKNNNMKIYESARSVPAEALKEIIGGKLKGKSDINPMWRLKTLTQLFGPCGIGWYVNIKNYWLEDGAQGERIANMIIELYIKQDGEWSKPIVGIGGNTIVQLERDNLKSNDEAFKMAYTDAISVACKMLGFAADVYFEKDKTKYGELGTAVTESATQPAPAHRPGPTGRKAPAPVKTQSKPAQGDDVPFPKESEQAGFNPEDYKCAICGKVISKSLFEKSIAKYGTPLCSAECKAVLEKAENLNRR